MERQKEPKDIVFQRIFAEQTDMKKAVHALRVVLESQPIGVKIRRGRKRIKLSQKDLASQIFISNTMLSEIERGNRKLPNDLRRKIEEILNIKL